MAIPPPTEAFRWTSSGGMVGLGDLPGGSFNSLAFGVSADGSVVVGRSLTASGFEAFIWDETNGMQRLADVLTDAGLDLTGWTLEQATGVSADGKTLVGVGTNPSGDDEAWVASLQVPALTPIDGAVIVQPDRANDQLVLHVGFTSSTAMEQPFTNIDLTNATIERDPDDSQKVRITIPNVTQDELYLKLIGND